ncbi:MAG TPA: RnfABCDGE type electron transport complex subunit C, partial [Candidatus Brocadiia bacterium]|nr:RnfABCDGE type electron transport complex subunit C [Candidatus Brocadiia bacterium]
WAPGLNVESDPGALSGDEIRTRILKAGVVGLGGATFPTHVKLSPPQGKPIDTVILNAAECEPYLACDYRLMMEKPAEVMEGFRLLMKVLGVRRGLVGVEANKRDAAEKLRAVSGDIEVVLVKVKYPQGAEAQMIWALLKREVPWKGGLPMDAGCVVQNVATAFAVYEALRWNRPLIQRVCSVTGEGVERPANYLVRVGTPLADVIAAAGLRDKAAKLILGGPMMGLAQGGSEMFCTKGTGGVLALCDAQPHAAGPCIRCGACVRACPCGLTPALLSRAVEAADFDACLAMNALECKQCGCCTYVCPARRPLMHQLKLALDELRRRKAEADAKAKAQAARAAV